MTAQSLVRAPYAILCEVLGHPQHRPPSGERVLWALDVGGTRATMREEVKAKPSVDLFDAPDARWQVTTDDGAKLEIVCRDVARRVIDAASKRAGARALRPEDKAKLNELVRQGIPLGEAMKRVRTEIVDDQARALYAWPIVETPLPGVAAKPERTRAPAARGDDDGDEGGDAGDDGGDEIDSGDDEGGGDISGDDDDRSPPPTPKAAQPARDRLGADGVGGELSGLARLLGALTQKPAQNTPATTATPTASVPVAKPAAKPATKAPATEAGAAEAAAAKTTAAKTIAAKTIAAKTTAAKPAAAKTTAAKTPATKTPAAKKAAAKPVAKASAAKKPAPKPQSRPAAKKPAAKKR